MKEKENWKKYKEKKKKIQFFITLKGNLFLAGYPVSGKIIGRISGQISIRYNPRLLRD